MKQFFKYTLATICGIVILFVVIGIFCMISLAGAVASSSSTTKVEKNSVLVLKMDGMVEERAEEGNPLDELLGEADMNMMGLDDLLSAIRKAKANENIKGIYLEGGVTGFDSPASAQQLRDALKDFKQSGKWIIAYADQYMQGAYYVSTIADSLFINQTGMIDLKGFGGKSYYLTGLYEKVGVRYQCTRVGKYKSAVESVTRKDMSENDREQRMAFIQAIWNRWTSDIAESRGIKPELINQLADDSIMAFAKVEDYKAARLVDGYFYPEQIKTVIRGKLGLGADDDISQLTLKDMAGVKDEKKEKGDKIALYYAYGEILDEKSGAFASEHAIIGRDMVEDINKLAADDDVKAVVLRVNSPGGSAVASEQIWHALKQLKEKKPLVVSMGGYAASGGYMISAPANFIVAEPTTVTGSIGIFGLIPNASELVGDKLGVTWDGVATNKNTAYETNLVFAKENAEELRHLQNYVDRGYETFLNIVAEGRGMTRDQVHEIAQGRVWVATDAKPIKLVDQIGSMDDAVKKAAELAGITGEYYTSEYPEKSSWIDELLKSATEDKGTYLDAQLKEVLGVLYDPIMQARKDAQRNRLQVRLPELVAM